MLIKPHGHKAKARQLKAAKDFQHSPRPGQGHTATILDQLKLVTSLTAKLIVNMMKKII